MPTNPSQQFELLKLTHCNLAKIHYELEAEMETEGIQGSKKLTELMDIVHEDIHECLNYVCERKMYLRRKIKELKEK